MRCDARGRIAAITDLNFSREDHIRGLLQFATSKRIGVGGIRRLKIQVGTTGNLDGVIGRRTEEERVWWCDGSIDTIRAVARFPQDETGLPWLQKAKEPFQFLAACCELVDALDTGPKRACAKVPLNNTRESVWRSTNMSDASRRIMELKRNQAIEPKERLRRVIRTRNAILRDLGGNTRS